MTLELLFGFLLPFGGTVLGGLTVFLMKRRLSHATEEALMGLAAGVMVAASVFSLLLPAISHADLYGIPALLPTTIGILLGFGLLLLCERIFPHDTAQSALAKTRMLVLSVTIHNIPEGMAVGVVMAACLMGDPAVSQASVIALALGIGIQNFPEGAIISMPLHSGGMKRTSAFLLALLSAIAELFGAAIALLMATVISVLLPYFLSFAAGAMLFAVVDELIPGTGDNHRYAITLSFAVGFCLMTALDITLG